MKQTTSTLNQPIFCRDSRLPFIEVRVSNGGRPCYDKHNHETFSIGSIMSGQASCWTSRGYESTGHGCVVMFNPQETHACNPQEASEWAYQMLYVQPEWLAGIQKENGQSLNHDFQNYGATVSENKTIYHNLNSVFRTLTSNQDILLKESTLIEFFADLPTGAHTEPSALKQNQRLQMALEFIADNCTQELDLKQIFEAAHLSRSYLIRAFKQKFGFTPHAFMVNQRIHFAQKQLKQGNSIAQAATNAGFADQAHFQRTFKRMVAATPRQYQGK